jgi:multiple sugar transport system ATP-binding protein
MARVQLRNVSKSYGTVEAVRDISFTVNDGEFFVIVGPSGCGKTTVLRLIAGLEQITTGEIFIGDRLVNNLPPPERKIAMVFESPTLGLYPHMTAYDNIAFGLRFRKDALPRESSDDIAGKREGESTPEAATLRQSAAEKQGAIKRRVETVAGRLGLEQYLHRKQKQLSSGHSQSLALGRAMVRYPDVFLMDCPMAQVDPARRQSIRAELRRRHRELAVTTIYVTHDQEEAMALGDRIAVMNEGAVEQIGSAQTLYAHPSTAFVAGFIGSPPMNLLRAQVEIGDENAEGGTGGEMYLRGQGFRLQVPDYLASRLSERVGSEILFGLRPEAIGDPRHVAEVDSPTHVTGKVVTRQYTGSDVYLYVSLPGEQSRDQQIVARVSEHTDVRVSDVVTVALDMTQLYAFDRTTGRTLL